MKLNKILKANGEGLFFAINGGIFEPDYSTSGLAVDGGKEKWHFVVLCGPTLLREWITPKRMPEIAKSLDRA